MSYKAFVSYFWVSPLLYLMGFLILIFFLYLFLALWNRSFTYYAERRLYFWTLMSFIAAAILTIGYNYPNIPYEVGYPVHRIDKDKYFNEIFVCADAFMSKKNYKELWRTRTSIEPLPLTDKDETGVIVKVNSRSPFLSIQTPGIREKRSIQIRIGSPAFSDDLKAYFSFETRQVPWVDNDQIVPDGIYNPPTPDQQREVNEFNDAFGYYVSTCVGENDVDKAAHSNERVYLFALERSTQALERFCEPSAVENDFRSQINNEIELLAQKDFVDERIRWYNSNDVLGPVDCDKLRQAIRSRDLWALEHLRRGFPYIHPPLAQ